MKKIVPFKKDIIFKTNIAEVTSISLEHTLHMEEDNLITGEFIVSGEYKITDSSTNTEVFNYNLPFDIHMDEKYILDDCEVDIYDFYYEIVNDNVMSVNIEVSVNKLQEKPVLIEREREIADILSEVDNKIETEKKIASDNKVDRNKVEELMKAIDEVKFEEKDLLKRSDEETVTTKINSVFSTANDNAETYTTYKVYIVRENDSVEMILENYQVTKEELEKYNDLKEIKIGDKLIIPSYDYAQN